MSNELEVLITKFAKNVHDIPDPDLDLPWEWLSYDEGVRFAMLRTIEQLYDLAAQLETLRCSSQPITLAQRLLGQYHAAYRDMQAVLLGVDDQLAENPPGESDWALHTVLSHIVKAEGTFFAITWYSIGRERAADGRPLAMSDEAWETFWAGDPFQQIEESGRFADLMAYYDMLHFRVLRELADIAPHELIAPVIFWEDRPMPVQFRLGRFGSHLRQHTIQMEKTLAALGLQLNEARHLLRRVYAALASLESTLIGAPELGLSQRQSLAVELEAHFADIQAIINT
jgi:hypothetical protein